MILDYNANKGAVDTFDMMVVLHVRKVNQTMVNKTFLLPRACCLTECFRLLVYETSNVET